MALESQINVYPNPSNGKFNIEVPQSFNIALLSVCDLMGKEIYSQNFSGQNSKYLLDLNGLSKGIYLLKIESKDQTVSKKLLID